MIIIHRLPVEGRQPVTSVDGADAAPARPAPVRPGSREAPDPALRTLRSVRRELLLDGRSSLRFASAARGECGIPHGSASRRRGGAPRGERPDRKGRNAARRGLQRLRLSALRPPRFARGQGNGPIAGAKSPRRQSGVPSGGPMAMNSVCSCETSQQR